MKKLTVLGGQKTSLILKNIFNAPIEQLPIDLSPRREVIILLLISHQDAKERTEEVVQILSKGSVNQVVLVIISFSVVLALLLLNYVKINRLWDR